jgi:hypothetical protein
VKSIRTPEKREAFLDALAGCGNVTAAAKAAKLARTALYEWRAADKRFASAWDAAQELGTDALEDEATRRAAGGTLRGIYHLGKRVGTVREFSDTLLIFLLKARKPDRFKDRSSTELTGKDGASLVPVLNVQIAGSAEPLGSAPRTEPGAAPHAGAGAPDRGH